MAKSIHKRRYKLLADWLKESRESKGLTQRELADRMHVHHSYVWKVESCERRLDLLEYVEYCEAIKCDPLEGFKLVLGGRA
jgi:transcriptional regulator with XRE-family HTH domain